MVKNLQAVRRRQTPKWEQVLHSVLGDIEHGKLSSGHPFYTLRELGAKYQISAVTAQRVFRELVDRHAITTRRRAGATVTGSAQTTTVYLCLRSEVFEAPGRLDLFREIGQFLDAFREGADGRFSSVEPVALDFLMAHLDHFRGKPFLVHANVLLNVVDGKGVLNEAVLNVLREAINPIVINSFERLEGVSQLVLDWQSGFHKLIDYLAPRHTRIGCLMGAPGCVWFKPRLQGYLDGLYANGLDFNPEWLKITSGLNSIEDFQALDAMLKGPVRPTAIVCGNDMRALNAIEYCKQHGIDVPGELAIVGCDNIPESAMSQPTLTTLDFCQTACGHLVADWILQRTLGRLDKPVEMRLNAELIVRDSG